ncbi:SGNH/GDSL hydrolase family protein [Amycolatopsis rifamycinica]|uniref:SGNH/GDSL hydrolase family protein n=1 Tax=Amycolatopsis rifamycinica TaxID=287986 RepID=UPI0013634E8D|nr:SGNH/GDSL hydrolase family protein [Amycolatopsis rifamycinica]
MMTALPSVASAAESVPPLQWPPVATNGSGYDLAVSTNGNVTVPCSYTNAQDLVTYNSAGQLVQTISRNQVVDGITNCISRPVVDKNGVVYGVPVGTNYQGVTMWGPNLLAYSGNTLKWKYPVASGCGLYPAVGANGIVYITTVVNGVQHIIGLTPDVATGQTQPTKVVDIALSETKCVYGLHPYKDGLMVEWYKDTIGNEYPGNPKFYSYSGKYLGQSPVSIDPRDEAVNADGQYFATQYTWGSYKSASVAMYNSRTRAVAWTTPASTSGANVQIFQLHAFQGGVVGIVNEQRMIGGFPATPTQYVYTIVTINSVGQKVRSVTLPYADPQGRTYGATSFSVDASGNVSVVRGGQATTAGGSTVSTVELSIYNAVSGAWSNQTSLVGDLGGTQPNSYYFGGGAVTANNTLFFTATCSGGCAYQKKLYAAKVAGLGVDYPRGEILTTTTPAQPVPVPYVALGDSYSSGEGVEPFEPSSNAGNNMCHRSNFAYSQLTSSNPKRASSLALGKFVACSGAETGQVLADDSTNGEQAQYKWLNASTKVVTITIGGNDIGFVPFGQACVLDACNFTSPAYATAVNNINNLLPSELETTYKKLLDTATGAKVYVLGYPQVAPVKVASDPMDIRCKYLYDSGYDSTGTIPKYWEDAQAARDVVTKLDAKIASVVSKVRGLKTDYQRLQYVDVNASGSPFAGHTVCADPGESYFNNLDQWVGHPAYALHPNARGQQAYADILAAVPVP